MEKLYLPYNNSMYSFTFNEDDNSRPIAEIIGGKDDGLVISVTEENDDNYDYSRSDDTPDGYGGAEIHHLAVKDGKFKVIPDPKNLRVILYTGSAGSGKTTQASQYIRDWEEMFPKSTCYVFSRLDDDPSLKGIKRMKRIALDESLISDPIEVEMFESGDIVLFDDDQVGFNKDIEKAIGKLKIELLERGRHVKDLSILITTHIANSGRDKELSRTILNEANAIVVYPSSGSTYNYEYVLNHYYGMSKKQVGAALRLRTRWVMIIKTVPNILLAEHDLHLLREFEPVRK